MNPAEDSRLKDVIAKRGLDVVSFIISTKITAHALGDIAGVVRKHLSRKGIMALDIATAEINALAMGYMELKGWTGEDVEVIAQEIETALNAPSIHLLN